jgi:hypothetical protein
MTQARRHEGTEARSEEGMRLPIRILHFAFCNLRFELLPVPLSSLRASVHSCLRALLLS